MAEDSANTTTLCHGIDGRMFELGCLAPALLIILILASLRRRVNFKHEYCNGYPGLLIPINFLGGFSNRYSIAATFGATASTCLAMFLPGKGSFPLSGPPWVKVFQSIIVVLIYGILFYPFFACLTTEYKLVGSLLGFVYGALRLSFKLAMQIRCCIAFKDFGVAQLSWILPTLPNDICLIFVVVRFAVLLSLRLRQRWLQSAESDSNSSSLAKEPDIIHVKLTLSQGSPYYSDGGKWFLKLLYFIYRPRTDFKFSAQLISTVLLGLIAIYEISVLLGAAVLEAYKEDISFFFGIKFFRLFQGCFHGAYVLSALVSLITMVHFLKCHRDHVLQLCRGQRDFMQNVCLSPASFVGRSLSFTGYQIAHALWGFIVWSVLLFVLFFVPAFLLVYKDLAVPKILLRGITSTAKSFIPSAVLAIFLWLFQRIVLSRWVFRNKDFPNFTVTIDNRRLFSVMSYIFVFLNVIVGLFACLLRLIKGLILGLFFLPRLDRTCLMQGFQRWDKGFVAYLGFVTVLVAHRHPVMLVFCQLLIDRNKLQQPDKETELQHPNHAKEAKVSAAYCRNIRNPRFSQKAVNRWLLAATLLRNPSLIQHRRQWYFNPIGMSEADTASITVLVQ